MKDGKRMNVIDRLATALGRRDEVPNQLLAKELAANSDKASIEELVYYFDKSKSNIKSDILKTLYEIGYINPKLISDYYELFLKILDEKNNRLVWGAMIALNTISEVKSKELYQSIMKIIFTMENGTVITKDNGIGILVSICKNNEYKKKLFPILCEQIIKSPPNQFPSYLEKASILIDSSNKEHFLKVISVRYNEFESPSKLKRIDKVLKLINKI